MTDTTYDEARRCPKCTELGRDESEKPGPHGSKLHIIRCLNQRCAWYDTTYVVQVNPDGTVPEANTNRPKNFPALPPRSDEAVERYNQSLLNQTLAGGETI